ncbi:hypothetical protein COCSADRAFT_39475, partial [Bipolaris sorokiniana ND90Pr]
MATFRLSPPRSAYSCAICNCRVRVWPHVYCAGLLCEWAYCCSPNLAIYAAAVSVDAKALVLLMFSVVSTTCFVGALVYVGLWAVSPRRSDEG